MCTLGFLRCIMRKVMAMYRTRWQLQSIFADLFSVSRVSDLFSVSRVYYSSPEFSGLCRKVFMVILHDFHLNVPKFLFSIYIFQNLSQVSELHSTCLTRMETRLWTRKSSSWYVFPVTSYGSLAVWIRFVSGFLFSLITVIMEECCVVSCNWWYILILQGAFQNTYNVEH